MPIGSLDVRDWKTKRRRAGAAGGPVRSRIESDELRTSTAPAIVVVVGRDVVVTLLVVVVLGIAWTVLRPLALDPSFNDFKPVPAGPLRSDTLALARMPAEGDTVTVRAGDQAVTLTVLAMDELRVDLVRLTHEPLPDEDEEA